MHVCNYCMEVDEALNELNFQVLTTPTTLWLQEASPGRQEHDEEPGDHDTMDGLSRVEVMMRMIWRQNQWLVLTMEGPRRPSPPAQ